MNKENLVIGLGFGLLMLMSKLTAETSDYYMVFKGPVVYQGVHVPADESDDLLYIAACEDGKLLGPFSEKDGYRWTKLTTSPCATPIMMPTGTLSLIMAQDHGTHTDVALKADVEASRGADEKKGKYRMFKTKSGDIFVIGYPGGRDMDQKPEVYRLKDGVPHRQEALIPHGNGVARD